MTDTVFLGKNVALFICLSVAILCHSLRGWRSGIFEDKVAFTGSNTGGKIKTRTCGFQQYLDPFRLGHLDTVENRQCTE